MNWIEVSVQTATESVDAVSNILIEAGSEGVAIEDSQDFFNVPDDGFGQIWKLDRSDFLEEGALVKAYFLETLFSPEIVSSIKEQILNLKVVGLSIEPNILTISEVAETNWATAWKQYYHSLKITRFLTIVPNWEDYETEHTDERIIRLDPGLAFGTGTHPTTILSLQSLENCIRGNETILDVGTGSGVLSIAAKALGAGKVRAYDLDDVAVRSAYDNILLNDYALDVEVVANNLLAGIEIETDIVVANILAEIILPLIPQAWSVLKPGGLFLASGIIETKKETVLTQLKEQEFEIIQVLQMKDWVAIIAKKPEEDE
ncbi:[LSU ribosomal protein L11P]-lysine N-methyltransferase [Carnobacterium iners]|uniref:Ribosomal protein L11 methyltransferase n=1 Tax=Carnobacterium iners TaxID=1073423 RepID=A0A1X7NGC5_9LACT|nr:50S ribosomal protein L11 methyltransferase [Carnobacterium iners]SEK40810.1 [LSU ribosomal protein L11P]-lysine N-methyltransferase [Carnobacterium iners]SMH36825.1 [LSU ribosomal protein L11P]-lysine N-methyltransferase [Carnobacterium iners]